MTRSNNPFCHLYPVGWLAALGLTAMAVDVGAQEPATEEIASTHKSKPKDFEEISLEDLLDSEVTVTTKATAMSQNDSPGIVTIISREEIQTSGARDLIDLLLQVPGFDFGVDIMSQIAPGMRGLWATEGKVLVLLDGHEMHELSYLGNLFYNRYPLDWIERIEIIRGPGSVIYGGAAELAVISIFTREAKDIHGVSIAATYGQMLDGSAGNGLPLEKTYGRRNISVSYGQTFSSLHDLGLKLDLFAGQGNVSDRDYTSLYGVSYNLAGNAHADPLMANLALDYRGLKIRYLFEYYRTTTKDGYGDGYCLTYNDAGYCDAFEERLGNDYITNSLQISYDWKILDNLVLVPRLMFIHQNPWRAVSSMAYELEESWSPVVERTQVGFYLNWKAASFLDLLMGADYTIDSSKDNIYGYPDPQDPENSTITTITFYNIAAYLQGLLTTPYINVSAGARFEQHSEAGLSFVPRAGLTKAFGPFHFKLLYSQAFRVPNIENFGANPTLTEKLKPERTSVIELELGYRFTSYLYLVANAFDITLDKPIVYVHVNDDAQDLSGYRNWGQTGTRGLEFSLRFRLHGTYATFTGSYYDAAGKNTVEPYQVLGNKHVLLGFSPYKFSLSGGANLTESLSLHVSAIYTGNQRFGYYSYDADGNPLQKEYPSQLLLNAFFTYKNLITPGFYASLGGYNLLNTEQLFIQPYNGGHAPMPGPSLEVLLKVGYDLAL